MSDLEIIQAFHLMWGNFPEAVMITQKSREIVELDKKAEEFGLKVGIKCSSVGGAENHKGCLLNRAVDENKPIYITYEGAFGKAYGFWIPIPEKSLNGLFTSVLVMRLNIKKFQEERLKIKWKVFME